MGKGCEDGQTTISDSNFSDPPTPTYALKKCIFFSVHFQHAFNEFDSVTLTHLRRVLDEGGGRGRGHQGAGERGSRPEGRSGEEEKNIEFYFATLSELPRAQTWWWVACRSRHRR